MLRAMYADEAPEEQLWDYGAFPVPRGRPYDASGSAAFSFAVEISFPPSDRSQIARRIRQALGSVMLVGVTVGVNAKRSSRNGRIRCGLWAARTPDLSDVNAAL